MKSNQFTTLKIEHAQLISDTLRKNLAAYESRLNAEVSGSTGLREEFEQLDCTGSDLAPRRLLTEDFVYVLNEPENVEWARGFAKIEPPKKLISKSRDVIREQPHLPLFAELIDVCNECELIRADEYSIENWVTQKAIEAVSYYEKISFVGKDRIKRWPDPSTPVDVLVTWGSPSFNKIGTYVETVGIGWKALPDSADADAYETIVTFCAYEIDTLALIARKKIIKRAPSGHMPREKHPDAPEGGVAPAINEAAWADTLISVVAGKEYKGQPLFPELREQGAE